MKINPIQSNFAAGEFSPRLYGRSDTEKYKAAVRLMRNFVPYPHGSTARRPGLKYIANTKAHDSFSRMIAFERDGTVYLLEIAHMAIRVYLNGGYLAEIAAPWASSETLVVSYVQTDQGMYFAHLNHAPRKLVFNGSTWTLSSPTFTAAAWSNYPQVVGFYQQRLWFANSPGKPQTIWGSKTSQFEDFTIGPNDADAVEYIVASDQAQPIRWLVGGFSLMAGGDNGVFTITGGQNPLTPSNVQITRESAFGCTSVRPVMLGTEWIHAQRGNNRIRALKYDYARAGLSSDEVSLTAQHLLTGGIVDMAATITPDTAFLSTLADGTLAWCTHLESSGWALFSTDGAFETVAAVQEGDHTAVYVVVRRTISGADYRTIERFDDAAWLDSWSVHSSVSSVSGLGRLEGKSVRVLADGAPLPAMTVTGGAIILPKTYATVYVGLAYNSVLETLPFEGGNPAGTSRIQHKHYPEIWIKLESSAAPIINGDRPPTQQTLTPMGTAQPLISVVRVHDLGWSRDGMIRIEQAEPLPCMVLAIYSTMETGEK